MKFDLIFYLDSDLKKSIETFEGVRVIVYRSEIWPGSIRTHTRFYKLNFGVEVISHGSYNRPIYVYFVRFFAFKAKPHPLKSMAICGK